MSKGQARLNSMPTKVFITREARDKINSLVQQVDSEVFWFGFVDQVEKWGFNYLRIYDIAIPEQEVSSGSVDIDGDWIGQLMERPELEEQVSKMNMFGHSHYNFDVFHSTVDWQQIHEWAYNVGVPWFISMVQNQKGELTARLDQFRPFRLHIDEIQVVDETPTAVREWVDDQVNEYVFEKKMVMGFNRWESGGGAVRFEPLRKEKRWQGAKMHYIRLSPKDDLILQRIVDGFVFESQDLRTGEITQSQKPDQKKRDEYLAELKESGEFDRMLLQEIDTDDWPLIDSRYFEDTSDVHTMQVNAENGSSRSLARSLAKMLGVDIDNLDAIPDAELISESELQELVEEINDDTPLGQLQIGKGQN